MSESYQLICRDYRQELWFGSKYYSEGRYRVQGISFEEQGEWANDERCWFVIQRFLVNHENHALLFTSDANLPKDIDPTWCDEDQLLRDSGWKPPAIAIAMELSDATTELIDKAMTLSEMSFEDLEAFSQADERAKNKVRENFIRGLLKLELGKRHTKKKRGWFCGWI